MIHPVHLKWFWWRPPSNLGDQMNRDLAWLVQFLGKGYFLTRIRNSTNEIVTPESTLLGGVDIDSPRPSRDAGLIRCCLMGTFVAERWMCLGFVAFVVAATVYVGDVRIAFYVGGAIALYWVLYFGSLWFAICRYSRWLDDLVRAFGSAKPVQEHEARLIAKRWSPMGEAETANIWATS